MNDLGDPQNAKVNLELLKKRNANENHFVKDYDIIKKQLDKIQEKYNSLSDFNDESIREHFERYRLRIIMITLNWVLSDIKEDL